MINPCERDAPEEDSVGTGPRDAPIVDPVSRCQSPTSTASSNPVNVEMARRQHTGSMTAVNSEWPPPTAGAFRQLSDREDLDTDFLPAGIRSDAACVGGVTGCGHDLLQDRS